MHSSKVQDSNDAHATRTRMCLTNTFKKNWVCYFCAVSVPFVSRFCAGSGPQESEDPEEPEDSYVKIE